MGLTLSFQSYTCIYRNRAGGVIGADHIGLYCWRERQDLQVLEGRVGIKLTIGQAQEDISQQEK